MNSILLIVSDYDGAIQSHLIKSDHPHYSVLSQLEDNFHIDDIDDEVTATICDLYMCTANDVLSTLVSGNISGTFTIQRLIG